VFLEFLIKSMQCLSEKMVSRFSVSPGSVKALVEALVE